MPPEFSDTWLSLDEAARRAGVSRLRVREAIAAGLCQARRDNHGAWRVALGADMAAFGRGLERARLAPEALVELLFDEIEDANAALADRDAEFARMSAIIARQQEMLDRAMSLAEAPPADPPRLAAADAHVVKLTGLLDRAFATIAALEGEAKLQANVAERQKGLLDRLFALAEASLERFAVERARGGGLWSQLRDRLGGRRGG